jgi:hypothetical protein
LGGANNLELFSTSAGFWTLVAGALTLSAFGQRVSVNLSPHYALRQAKAQITTFEGHVRQGPSCVVCACGVLWLCAWVKALLEERAALLHTTVYAHAAIVVPHGAVRNSAPQSHCPSSLLLLLLLLLQRRRTNLATKKPMVSSCSCDNPG